MADKKEFKGIVGSYNGIPVTKRKYYYDYNDESAENKGFADSFSELKGFNTKLKKELESDKATKLKIDQPEDVSEACSIKKKKKNEKSKKKNR